MIGIAVSRRLCLDVVCFQSLIVSLVSEFSRGKGAIYMVFEYMDHDLTGLLDLPGIKFSAAQIKCYVKQLLEGLHYLHRV